jgi:myo-inositol 2-dehydrogenase / D-chiro-inositol 1-dehydrogenase
MTLGICLVGAGRIGRIHASNIVGHPNARLVGVVDVDGAAATAVAGEVGCRALNLSQALASADVDAVVIATSTDTHLDLIAAWVDAGKPILCEKPLDLDTERARLSQARAAAAAVPLFVGFNRRFDPSFRRLRDELRAGSIGALEVVTITSRDPSPPPLDYVRRSGGLFRDMTIHDLDMARWLLDEEPVRVFATGGCLIDPAIGAAGDIDTAALVLETASGRIAQITNSRRCRYGYDQRIEVLGADGMLRAGNRTQTTVQRADAGGFTSEPALPFFLERYAEAYRLELAGFVDAVSGGDSTLAAAEDGVRALVLAEAAERSRRESRVVAIDG